MIGRRGFLGFLFGAAAAVPAIAKGGLIRADWGEVSLSDVTSMDQAKRMANRWRVRIDPFGKILGVVDTMPGEPAVGNSLHTVLAEKIEYR